MKMSMESAANQATLFPMPEVEKSTMATAEERAAEFANLATARGGLYPRSAIQEILGVHKSRVPQLIENGDLEEIQYFGVSFITGRSLREWQATERGRGGRGIKRLGIWKKMVVGWKVGNAYGEAVIPG